MKRIAPSILSADFSILKDEIASLDRAGADMIHIDVMDGHFVPNLTFGPPVISSIRSITSLPFDVHLMIENPDRTIQDYIDAGSDYLTVHAEAAGHLHRTIQAIRERGVKAGVSLNPATPLACIEDILSDIDMLLIMTVNPGFGGQSFIESMIPKIGRARALIDETAPGVLLEVDGGVKKENIRRIAKAGADVFVAGSAIFRSGNYGRTIRDMREAAEEDA